MIYLEEIRKNLIERIENNAGERGAKAELARKLCIKESVISNYLYHNVLPALDTFANLCVELGESADEILGINAEIEKRLKKSKD